MNRYSINEIVAMSADEVWELPEEQHIIEFDDEDVVTHTRATILTWLYFQFFKEYPLAPKLAKWHVENTGFDGRIQIDVISDIFYTIKEHYQDIGDPINANDMDNVCMEIVQSMYNHLSTKNDEYQMSSSLIDLLEILDHPEIVEANKNMVPTQEGIEGELYPRVGKVIKDSSDLRHNTIQIGVRSGSYPLGQVLQCATALGFSTDIDGAIGRYPIMKGYAQGIINLGQAMLESRKASKAILYNQELIQNTEYFNREVQLVCSYLQRMHRGDCGTTTYIKQTLLKDTSSFYIGKHYLLEDGTLGAITRENHWDLIGKPIQMRSVLGCQHPDPQGVCEICYGRMSEQMVDPITIDGVEIPGTVIGHESATVVCGRTTSVLFATKHHDSTSHIDEFILNRGESMYLNVVDNDEIFLKPVFKKRRYTLSFLASQLPSITDLSVVDDVRVLKPQRVSCIGNMLVNLGKYDPLGNNEPVELHVSSHNRKPSLSLDALAYIKERGWSQNQRGDVFTVDFSDFDISKPLLKLPFVHVNSVEYKEELKQFLFSSKKSSKAFPGRGIARASSDRAVLTDFKDVGSALNALINLNPKNLGANIVHFETLLAVLMIRDPNDFDYRMPINGAETGEFAPYNAVMANRGAGALMAYQGQEKTIGNFRFVGRTKLNHSPLDTMLLGGSNLVDD